MALQITGQPQGILSASQKAGTPASVNTGWQNELLKSDLLPRYAYLVLNGVTYSVGQTAAAVLAAVGTGVTGLTLFNPANSGKNLLVLDIGLGFTPITLATVGITVVLAGTPQATTPTGVSALTAVNNLVGSGNLPVAKTYSAATLAATPGIMRVVGNWQSTVLATNGGATATGVFTKDEVAGAIIVAPGSAICLAGIGTVADASVAASMTWAELPI